MAIIAGIPGDDELTGMAFDDIFQFGQISDFTADGLGGNDHFRFQGTFLVADADGNSFYTAGSDYVIDITGFTGTITTGNFA